MYLILLLLILGVLLPLALVRDMLQRGSAVQGEGAQTHAIGFYNFALRAMWGTRACALRMSHVGS